MPKIKDLGINVVPETMRPPEIGPGGGCGITVGPVCPPGSVTYHVSTATCIPNSCCVDPSVACGCTHVTNPCFGCTQVPTFCTVHTITVCANFTCGFVTPATCHPHSICAGGSVCPGGSACTFVSHTVTFTGTITTTTPVQTGGGLTRESIAQLREQLQQQIAQLDEAAKSIGPRTAEEIDAREKQLRAELDELATRRSDLKKK
ncbi:MAG: hypothetical protein JO197_17775 [Acidobacteria bacterium]|nr:hypothetical protein [Acidobacteriota bacterium]MBV9478954.1 hypothetical protein [Acidobacteriota bacterium]